METRVKPNHLSFGHFIPVWYRFTAPNLFSSHIFLALSICLSALIWCYEPNALIITYPPAEQSGVTMLCTYVCVCVALIGKRGQLLSIFLCSPNPLQMWCAFHRADLILEHRLIETHTHSRNTRFKRLSVSESIPQDCRVGVGLIGLFDCIISTSLKQTVICKFSSQKVE